MDSPLSATTTRKQEGSPTPRETLTITDNRTGKSYEVPVTHDTIRAADLRQIKVDPKDFGMMSYDPAFNNTASCISKVTFIDGDAGILRYRGYPIEDLAEKSTYLETAYLLLHGDLPTATQLKDWTYHVTHHTFIHESIKKFLDGFHYDAHPMGMTISTIAALSTLYHDAATAAAIAALYGPLHGGANEEVLRMLMEIGSVQNVPAFIKRVKAGEVKLMGFGHRVYKNYDPRARIIKHIAYQVFDLMGKNPLLEIALECERIALEDDYFIKRKLYPNVDFYTGLIYQSMGFPMTMFPVLFAIPRTSGWIAQWEEMLLDPEQKIARPRQIYLGHDTRTSVLIEQRS